MEVTTAWHGVCVYVCVCACAFVGDGRCSLGIKMYTTSAVARISEITGT